MDTYFRDSACKPLGPKSVELTVQYLEKLKNSKSSNLDITDIKISPYLIDERFSKSER